MREQAFLPARQEHGVELEPLGGVQGHDRDRVGISAAVRIHHQRDVLEETLQVLELFHGAYQLLEVFEPAGRVGGMFLLPHLGVAGLIEHDLGKLVVWGDLALSPPAVERGDEVAQRRARLGLELLGRRLPVRDHAGV
jgi:hypothetical protein